MSTFISTTTGFQPRNEYDLPETSPDSFQIHPAQFEVRHGEDPFDSSVLEPDTFDHDESKAIQPEPCPQTAFRTYTTQDIYSNNITSNSMIQSLNLNAFLSPHPRTAPEDSQRDFHLLSTRQSFAPQDSFHPSTYTVQADFAPSYASAYISSSSFHSSGQSPYPEALSTDTLSPMLIFASPADNWSSPSLTACQELSLEEEIVSAKHDPDEDERSTDKPYARLIYDALMQAPNHRMMLREIYGWFQCNTNKATEAGSNGWQNSIRHNLSMNQAFENDKGETTNCIGPARKANSIWILTENAIRNGVQSTTRYRKSGNGKKSAGSRTPAPSRQRSGARGGRAARRAAKGRNKGPSHLYPGSPDARSVATSDPSAVTKPHEGMQGIDYASIYSYSPTTPTHDPSFSFAPPSGFQSYPDQLTLAYGADEAYGEDSNIVKRELDFHPHADPFVDVDELATMHCGSKLERSALECSYHSDLTL